MKKFYLPDIKMVTFYDRDNLMDFCTETISHNLIEGILLVTLIVFIFMFDWRTTVIVSIIIPLSLLFAFICLKDKRHDRQPAFHGCNRFWNHHRWRRGDGGRIVCGARHEGP